MATLTISKAKYQTGILHPLLETKFQIRYRTTNMTSEQCANLTMQTTKFEMDLKNKLVKFEIQQPIAGDLIADVQELVSFPQGITMHHMDGEGNSYARTSFTMLECVSHSLLMDYAGSNQVATHRIVMKYLTVNTKE